MSDLIDRQQAIDALQKEINKGKPPFDNVIGSIRCGVRLARNIIEDLPSAQSEIIRCKDCAHYHTDVFGGELGATGFWKNIIVAHNACDKWTKDMNCVTPDGFCFLAERRTDV